MEFAWHLLPKITDDGAAIVMNGMLLDATERTQGTAS
jgi:hypothetical protein